jgi:hypothetical protein
MTRSALASSRRTSSSLLCLLLAAAVLVFGCARPEPLPAPADRKAGDRAAADEAKRKEEAARREAAAKEARDAQAARAKAAEAEAARKKADAAAKENPLLSTLYAGVVDDERLLMTGPAADGVFGDFCLRNERVHAIVTAAGHAPYLAKGGGVLADIGLADRRQDMFGFLNPTLVVEGKASQFEAERVEVVLDGSDGETAEIAVHGRMPAMPSVACKQVYRLRKGAERLEVETIWTNEGAEPSPKLEPVEAMHWGSLNLFIPGRGALGVADSSREPSEGTWLMGLAKLDDALLALYSDTRAIKGDHERNFSLAAFGFAPSEERVLAPGATLRLLRFLRPGGRDMAETVNKIVAEQAFPTGEIYGKVYDTTDQKNVVAGARVRLDHVDREKAAQERKESGKTKKSGPAPYAQTYTNAAGEFVFRMPPGDYFARGDEPTRYQNPSALSTFVEPNSVVEKELRMAPPNLVAFDVRDAATNKPIPCKLTFTAARSQDFHYMGPPWEAPYCRNTYYSVAGSGLVEVPSGEYLVTISRGPEYTIYSEKHAFTRNLAVKPMKIEAKLERVVDTTGWIAMEFGSRTSNSWDSLVSEEDRLIAAVAEGVELIIPGDFNHVTDLRDDIERLQLGDRIKAGLGVVLRDPKRRGDGEFGVFPLLAEPLDAAPDALAALAAEPDPATLFAALRERFPGALIQANRPLDPEYGYLARHGYAATRGALFYAEFDASYSKNYDLLEVMRGRQTAATKLDDLMEPWHQLILTGDDGKRFNGGSASRTLHGEETGYPRLYVKSSTDDPAKIDLAEIAENVRRGAVILTTGPFLDLKVFDAGPGEKCQLGDDNFLYYDIQAFAPVWMPIVRVSVDKEGHFFARPFIIERGDKSRQYPEPLARDRVRRVRPLRDWCVTLSAEGLETMEPVLSRQSPSMGDIPLARAISGPVFFDYDLDGKYTPPPPSRRHRG